MKFSNDTHFLLDMSEENSKMISKLTYLKKTSDKGSDPWRSNRETYNQGTYEKFLIYSPAWSITSRERPYHYFRLFSDYQNKSSCNYDASIPTNVDFLYNIPK